MNGNGRTSWQYIKDVIQVLILPLLFLVWNQVSSAITENAAILRKIEGNQIRVITTVGMLEAEIKNIELEHARTSADRARVHHTTNRNCLECKMPGQEHYPRLTPTPKDYK